MISICLTKSPRALEMFCQRNNHHHAHKVFHTCDSQLTSSNINIFQKSFQLELLLCQTGNCEKFSAVSPPSYYKSGSAHQSTYFFQEPRALPEYKHIKVHKSNFLFGEVNLGSKLTQFTISLLRQFREQKHISIDAHIKHHQCYKSI